MSASHPLTDKERATLAAACDAFHPSLEAEPGDDQILFSLSAGTLGVPAAVEAAVALLSTAQRGELKQLLALLNNAAFGLGVARVPRALAAMSRDEQRRFLLALATSPIPQLRSGFQALRRLSSFMYYSATDDRGENRVWPRIRYEPSTLPPPSPSSHRLSLSDPSKLTTIDADVCVIGSGAGGGVAAAELAKRGLKVVVLEAGPGDQAADFDQQELSGMQRLYLDSALTATRDLGLSILAGACLGGGTTVNWQTCLRTPDDIRDEWADRSGCDVFTSERFTRALDSVWTRLRVSTDETVVNGNNAPIRSGCDALGYSWTLINRNSSGCSPEQCGYCTFGCRIGGKQSTTVTYLRDAQCEGDTVIFTSCRANRITMRNGRATGVIAIARDAEGRESSLTVHAPRVVVAAGGIESPALLQRTGLPLRHVGRNLFLHPTTAVAGLYEQSVEPWCGPPQSILGDEFSSIDGRFGFRLETAPVHPGLLALAVPWTGPADHRRLMQRSSHASGVIVLTRDETAGQVRSRRDGSTVIDYTPGQADRERIIRGIIEATRVHVAAGAQEVVTLHTESLRFRRTALTNERDIESFCRQIATRKVHGNRCGLFSAHQMGTCRMGRDGRTAVCDSRGEVFGMSGLFIADASAFPASSGVNPMITVMALAQCVAETIE